MTSWYSPNCKIVPQAHMVHPFPDNSSTDPRSLNDPCFPILPLIPLKELMSILHQAFSKRTGSGLASTSSAEQVSMGRTPAFPKLPSSVLFLWIKGRLIRTGRSTECQHGEPLSLVSGVFFQNWATNFFLFLFKLENKRRKIIQTSNKEKQSCLRYFSTFVYICIPMCLPDFPSKEMTLLCVVWTWPSSSGLGRGSLTWHFRAGLGNCLCLVSRQEGGGRSGQKRCFLLILHWQEWGKGRRESQQLFSACGWVFLQKCVQGRHYQSATSNSSYHPHPAESHVLCTPVPSPAIGANTATQTELPREHVAIPASGCRVCPSFLSACSTCMH